MTLGESWKQHAEGVKKVAQKFGNNAVVFSTSPFDIIDLKTNRFYEVKTASVRKGRHRTECRIHVSRDELKFGSIFGDKLTFVILFDGKRFDIPFSHLQARITRNVEWTSVLGGFKRIHHNVTLGKSFLARYAQIH
jgi:hypothetical protein